jgi:DNA (cytosine-5)-methyltransferase 1
MKYTCELCTKKFMKKKDYNSHECEIIETKIEEEQIQLVNPLLEPIVNFVDLFTGTGAFSYAFETTGRYKCVFANDIMESSKKIYELNFGDSHFELKDLNEINVNTIPRHRLLCGGFPCQSFSIAGKRLGFEDERANVFWKILEILQEHNTEVVILENVKNLKSHDDGNTYRIIENELHNLGYFIKSAILDTCKITHVPQHRERIYIVCFKDKAKYDAFHFDFEEVPNQQIQDFLEEDVDEKYYYTPELKVYQEITENVTKHIRENVLYQYRRYYVRENKSNCCPTLTANMGTGGHNVPLLLDDRGVRKLTPRECFRLQGFPENYKLPHLADSNLYKLAGNAVSVPVVQLIVNKINQIF